MAVNQKVGASAIAGAITVIGVWALGAFAHVTVPPEVASAATVIISALVGWAVPSA